MQHIDNMHYGEEIEIWRWLWKRREQKPFSFIWILERKTMRTSARSTSIIKNKFKWMGEMAGYTYCYIFILAEKPKTT